MVPLEYDYRAHKLPGRFWRDNACAHIGQQKGWDITVLVCEDLSGSRTRISQDVTAYKVTHIDSQM